MLPCRWNFSYKSRVLLSCKITLTVLLQLDREGINLTPILEKISVQESFLRDPNYWLPAEETENFLASAEKALGMGMAKMAHKAPELRSWGVLDSVLRLMSQPTEVLIQPEKILAYFVAPPPPVGNLLRLKDSTEFDVPISSEAFPHCTAFLAASMECLPCFAGKPLGHCTWDGIHCKFWITVNQDNFLDNLNLDTSLSPEMMRNLLASLEKNTRDLEIKNRELQERNQELLSAKKTEPQPGVHSALRETTMAWQETRGDTVLVPKAHPGGSELLHEVSRLADYMVRAQQLIGLLAAQRAPTAQVQEAMRRLDWEKVQNQFAETVENCRRLLQTKES